jgi:hypothetical protein
MQIDAAYQQARRPNKRMSIATWLNDFRKAYNDARRIDLPAVSRFHAHMDFIRAARTWSDSWAESSIHLLNTPDVSKRPSVIELIDSFNRYRDLLESDRALTKALGNPGTIATASSTATASFSVIHDTNRRQPKQCLCYEFHWWRECPYLNKAIRTTDWKPDDKISDEIAEKLKNENLKALIDKSLKRDREYQTDRNSDNPEKRRLTRPQRHLSEKSDRPTTTDVVDDSLSF